MRDPNVIDAEFRVVDPPKADDPLSRLQRREAIAVRIAEVIGGIIVLIGCRWLYLYLMHHPHWLR